MYFIYIYIKGKKKKEKEKEIEEEEEEEDERRNYRKTIPPSPIKFTLSTVAYLVARDRARLLQLQFVEKTVVTVEERNEKRRRLIPIPRVFLSLGYIPLQPIILVIASEIVETRINYSMFRQLADFVSLSLSLFPFFLYLLLATASTSGSAISNKKPWANKTCYIRIRWKEILSDQNHEKKCQFFPEDEDDRR